MRRIPFIAAAALTLAGPFISVRAQTDAAYPQRPVRMLVGFGAGGVTDVTARQLADGLGKALGQPVVVENRTGAGGNIASAELARAAPDGYLLMLGSPGQLVVNPMTQKSVGFDPRTVFTPITLTNESPFVFVVPANSPFKSVADLVAWGKANDNKLSFGSPGVGTTMHIAGEILQASTGIRAVHVPYRGGAQATTDLIAGRLDFMIDSMGQVSSQVRAGQLKVLAAAGPERLKEFPNVPTLEETWPDFEVSSWLALVGPPNLPAGIRDTLVKAADAAVHSPAYVKGLEGRGSRLARFGPAALTAHLANERKRIDKAVVQRGLTLD